MADNEDSAKGFNFKAFATPRIIGGIVIIIIVLWALTILFGTSDKPETSTGVPHEATATSDHEATGTAGDHASASSAAAQHASDDTHGSAHEATTGEDTHQSDEAAAHDTASTP